MIRCLDRRHSEHPSADDANTHTRRAQAFLLSRSDGSRRHTGTRRGLLFRTGLSIFATCHTYVTAKNNIPRTRRASVAPSQHAHLRYLHRCHAAIPACNARSTRRAIGLSLWLVLSVRKSSTRSNSLQRGRRGRSELRCHSNSPLPPVLVVRCHSRRFERACVHQAYMVHRRTAAERISILRRLA